jgi:YVTN family beta-propeller protein
MRGTTKQVLWLVVLSSCLGWGQLHHTQSYRLYVDNSQGASVSVIDLDSLKVIDDLQVGQHVHGIAVQPDGKRLFATIESDHTLRVVDLESKRIIGTVPLDGRPNQCAVTPDGKYVVVPIRDGDKVDIVNIAAGRIEKALPIKEPHNAVPTATNEYVYISSMGGNEIDVIDLARLDYSAHIPVGGRPRPYVVSRNGEKLYVAIANLHGFHIVDVKHTKLLQSVDIPSKWQGPPRPRKFETPDTFTHGLALTPDETQLWVTSLIDNAVYVYDLRQQKVVGNVRVGDGPNWIVFSPDGRYAAVSNTDSNDVSIIAVTNRNEVARIAVGQAPKRLAIGIVP